MPTLLTLKPQVLTDLKWKNLFDLNWIFHYHLIKHEEQKVIKEMDEKDIHLGPVL